MVETQGVYNIRADVMKALAHPSRLIMLNALMEGEKSVCELQEPVGSSMSTVSRHLSLMKNAGVVEDRRDGNHVYYKLLVPCVLSLFPCIDDVLHSEAERVVNELEE